MTIHWTCSFRFLSLITFLALAAHASAAKLFEVRVTPAVTAPFVVEDDSLLDLVDDLINTRGPFSALSTQPFSADATYYGVREALLFTVDTAGTSVRLQSPLTGLDVTFTGTSRAEVEDQIEDWLKDDGAKELSALDAAISKKSAAAPNDGNPLASTALLADQAFFNFAFGKQPPGRAAQRATDFPDESFSFTFGLGFDYRNADIDTDVGELSADHYSLPLTMEFGMERVNLVVDIPLSYTEVAGTAIYGAGVMLGVPITAIPLRADQSFLWQITPFGGILGRGTVEGVNGALIYSGGLASRLAYRLPDNFFITLGNQIGTYHSADLEVSDVRLERDVDQRILKNGLQLSRDLDAWVLEVHAVDTRFLESAAVRNYQTYGASARYYLNPDLSVSGGYDYTDGDDYSGHQFSASARFRF